MRIRSYLSVIMIILSPAFCMAQDLNSKTLITVDGRKTEAGEFIRMFNKSKEPGKKPDVDEYLKQFTVFKLKVADAMHQGHDTTIAFRSELDGYRTQLAQNYLTDLKTTEKILLTAYQRSLTEINAWHILIATPSEASPADTLRAFKKAEDIRERIIQGESFEHVARGASDDKSVLMNGGNLGYFTVFQMIMPFEDAAYSLKKNEISKPVRTPYGYHIITVADKRPSRGRIKVAHIMKSAPPGVDDATAKKAEDEITSLFSKLQDGASFSELARSFSDHKESAGNNGELEWFGTGEIISDFTEAAFSLNDTGTYSNPVRTLYGWHIIRLIDKKMPRSYEESRSFLESRINKSYLNSISRKSFIEKLKKDYNFRVNPESYNWFIINTDTLIIQGLKKYNRNSMPSGNIYTFADQKTTTADFAGFIEKRGYMVATTDSAFFISSSLETKSSDQLIRYENSILERKNPEFRYLMNEFHDGILLFEISGKRVWNRVSEDSAGLRKYYQDHKNEYLTRQGINTIIYTLRDKDALKKLTSAYQKYSEKKNSDELLAKKFNNGKDTILVIKEKRWFRGDDQEIDKLEWEKGSQPFHNNGFPSIIRITDVIDPAPLSFEEIQGEMMTGYQEFLENSWVEQLKKKYSVKIDNLVLGEVKRKLSNE